MLERQQAPCAVIDGPERSKPQHLRERRGVDPVILWRGLRSSADVADDHAIGVRLQQVVEPLHLGSFFERNVHARAGRAYETEDRLCSVRTVERIVMTPCASRRQATTVD